MTFLGGGDVGVGGDASSALFGSSVTVVVAVAIAVEVKEQRECQRKRKG
jgi:hypothetical protein